MRTLLEISDDMAALLDLIDEGDGELSIALDTWFAEIGAELEDKADSYCGLIRTLELRAAARREEQDRLAKRVAVDESAARQLKQRLRDHMQRLGMKKLETRRFAISVQTNGGAQAVDVMVPPEQLPAFYQRVEVTADVDRIRKSLAAGHTVEGCVLQARGFHLRIR